MGELSTRTIHEYSAQDVFDIICTAIIRRHRPHRSPLGLRSRMGKSGRNGALGQLVLGYDENIELEITPMSSFSRETLTKLGWKYDPKTQKPYHWDLVVALQSAYEHAFLHYHRGNFTTLFAGMADTAGRRLNLNTNVLIH